MGVSREWESERIKAAAMLIEFRQRLSQYRTGELLLLREAVNDVLKQRSCLL